MLCPTAWLYYPTWSRVVKSGSRVVILGSRAVDFTTRLPDFTTRLPDFTTRLQQFFQPMIFRLKPLRFEDCLFERLKKAWKKRVFCDFKDYFDLFDVQTTLKNIARILYNFRIFGILKKTYKFVKIGKTSRDTLEGLSWYGEIMSLQFKNRDNYHDYRLNLESSLYTSR